MYTEIVKLKDIHNMQKEVRYFISAEVEGQLVFSSDYPDTTLLTEELYKAEEAVERALEDSDED